MAKDEKRPSIETVLANLDEASRLLAAQAKQPPRSEPSRAQLAATFMNTMIGRSDLTQVEKDKGEDLFVALMARGSVKLSDALLAELEKKST